MIRPLMPLLAAGALLASGLAAGAQQITTTPIPMSTNSSMGPTGNPTARPGSGGMMASPSGGMMASPSGGMMASPSGGNMSGGSMSGGNMSGGSMKGGMKGSMMKGSMMKGMEHGMPMGRMGADGTPYTGTPDLQAAISLVTAGGAPGNFSLAKALTAMVGSKMTGAEVAKLTKQYGAAKVASFIAVQNFAVNDAVKIALAAGVKFPKPMLHGTALASKVVMLGVQNGAYYEGVQLDHLVTHAIHERVMDDIDAKFGAAADGNYHRLADQAHYDLAQALGATSVKLAPFH